jgi:hypothetical protein
MRRWLVLLTGKVDRDGLQGGRGHKTLGPLQQGVRKRQGKQLANPSIAVPNCEKSSLWTLPEAIHTVSYGRKYVKLWSVRLPKI